MAARGTASESGLDLPGGIRIAIWGYGKSHPRLRTVAWFRSSEPPEGNSMSASVVRLTIASPMRHHRIVGDLREGHHERCGRHVSKRCELAIRTLYSCNAFMDRRRVSVSTVTFPVRCPVCGNDVLAVFQIADVIGVLINYRKIPLYANCHDATWNATDVEMRQLQKSVDMPWRDRYVTDDSGHKQVDENPLKQQQLITHLTRVAILGELSGAPAHELQQTLTAILSNAQAAQQRSRSRHCARSFRKS
jgi:C4-dicarboxylate-specific signal transduction histidine kinase